uniref:Uncharacterized protein n=1 Tax=Trichogramma kaykai TaxID=54128 RepID=A0ABD2X6I8_9HYME
MAMWSAAVHKKQCILDFTPRRMRMCRKVPIIICVQNLPDENRRIFKCIFEHLHLQACRRTNTILCICKRKISMRTFLRKNQYHYMWPDPSAYGQQWRPSFFPRLDPSTCNNDFSNFIELMHFYYRASKTRLFNGGERLEWYYGSESYEIESSRSSIGIGCCIAGTYRVALRPDSRSKRTAAAAPAHLTIDPQCNACSRSRGRRRGTCRRCAQ